MLICQLRGGFGNHLLNYGLACVLSHKYSLKIKIISNAIKNDHLEQRIDTRTTLQKIVNYDFITEDEINNSNLINITNEQQFYNLLENLDKSKNYSLNIIGTRLEFYTKNIDILKVYTKFNYSVNDKNEIFVSLRLGMGLNEVAGHSSPYKNELRLPFIYYKKSIDYFIEKNNNIKKIIICSDNFQDSYLQNFYNTYKQIEIIEYKKNTLEQFTALINANYFVSSNSTYALLACVFNTKGKVITPYFKEKDDYNLSPNTSNSFKMKIDEPNSFIF